MATVQSKPDEEIPITLKTTKMKISNIPVPVSKCQQVTTILIRPSASAMLSIISIAFIPIVVMPKLAIPADAYPEHLNKPGGGKDYLCQLSHFSHFNLDSILTHDRRHLDTMVVCPVCGRGYQNMTSHQKHGRDAHKIQIVASTTSLQGFVDPKRKSGFLILLFLISVHHYHCCNILLITHFVPLHLQCHIVMFLSLIPHGSVSKIL